MSAMITPNLRPIDINLLQRRTAKVQNGNLFSVLMILITAAGLGAMGWLWFDARADIRTADQSLTQVNTQISQLQEQIAGAGAGGQMAQFLQLPDYLKNKQPLASDVLKQLTGLLPMRSDAANLSIAHNRDIQLTAIFDSTESVIAFSEAVQSSPAFQLISMSGFNKLKLAKDKQAQANGQTGADSNVLPVIQMTFQLRYTDPPTAKEGQS